MLSWLHRLQESKSAALVVVSMALFTDILVYGMVVPIFTPETLGMSTLQVRYAAPR